MSRYTGPSWKQSRRLGFSLTGTGKELARRNYVPGQHGPNNRSKLSEYGLQLAEKQKLRFSYGLGEKQFRNLFVQATKVKGGTLGFNFMVLLERRLDNVVYLLIASATVLVLPPRDWYRIAIFIIRLSFYECLQAIRNPA